MKDGRTHLAPRSEQAVDMATGALVGVTIHVEPPLCDRGHNGPIKA